jgi:hypothetical protein
MYNLFTFDTYTCIYIHTYIYMYVYMYMYIYVYIYIYIYQVTTCSHSTRGICPRASRHSEATKDVCEAMVVVTAVHAGTADTSCQAPLHDKHSHHGG